MGFVLFTPNPWGLHPKALGASGPCLLPSSQPPFPAGACPEAEPSRRRPLIPPPPLQNTSTTQKPALFRFICFFLKMFILVTCYPDEEKNGSWKAASLYNRTTTSPALAWGYRGEAQGYQGGFGG